MTIRDRIKAIQVNLRDHAVTPALAREHLMTLTALLGNVTAEQADADIAYKRVILKHFEIEQAASRARMHAETTEEYRRYLEARNLHELVIEMIRSCKRYLESLDDELRHSGH